MNAFKKSYSVVQLEDPFWAKYKGCGCLALSKKDKFVPDISIESFHMNRADVNTQQSLS